MIINPYDIKLNTSYKGEVEYVDQIIEESIKFLIADYKKLLEKKSEIEISKVLKSRLIEQNLKINDDELNEIIKKILSKIFGYGILQKYIDDELTTDIRAVSYKNIYIKKLGRWSKIKEHFKNKEDFDEFIRYSVLKNGASINYENPVVIVSDRKKHLRIEAGIDPVNINESSIVIRIHKDSNLKDMESLYVKDNMFPKEVYLFLIKIINDSKNVLIVGKGGSGKTTLLRAILDKLPRETSISTNEETAELYLKDRNVIQREISIRKSENKSIDLEKLTRHSLVMSNDVIVIGELKGKEAGTFFDAISTGHIGYTTVHSDSIENSIDRLIVLIKKDIKAQGYTDNFLRRFISSSLDYVIYMENYSIKEIASLNYQEEKNIIVKNTIYNKFYQEDIINDNI